MASLTSLNPALGILVLHPIPELGFVRIFVAALTAEVLPVIDRRRLRLECGGLFMAIRARNRHVPAC